MAAASNCLRLQSAFSCGVSRSPADCQTPRWSNAGDSCNLGFARRSTPETLTPAFGGVHSVYSGSSSRAHPCRHEVRLRSTFRDRKAGRQCRPLRNSHFLGSVNGLLQQSSCPTNQGPQSSRIVNEASTEVGEPKQRTKLLNPTSITVPLGDRTITIETGRMGRQANGAVMVTDGETVLYCTACADNRPCEPGDFAPFQVHYQERFSAAGRTTGGFIKREGRPRDNEVLISRLVDRPLRPMCAKGFNHETQVLVWVLSYDGVHSPEPLAILAAGAALAISDIPSTKPVAGVRVGMREDGTYIVNPTKSELRQSKLDMMVAGTADAVLMIEGYCDCLSEEQTLGAVQAGQDAVSEICRAVDAWAKEVGKPKMWDKVVQPPEGLEETLESLVGAELDKVLRISKKQERGAKVAEIGEKALSVLTKKGRAEKKDEDSDSEDEVFPEGDDVVVSDDEAEEPVLPEAILIGRKRRLYEPDDVKRAFKELNSRVMRRIVVQENRRSDGRSTTEVRPIECSGNLLPRVHGSALFTRGETQALAVVTIGGEDMAQKQDNMQGQQADRFYLQYTFPPSSVGETKRVGAPGRREIGHGMLAQRSLEPVLPPQLGFPYTMRVESTITESNGSSSMASVCGGCLALLDAGIPLSSMVAGVAMGLILDTASAGGDGQPMILTDILGSEDALGDMDFKVAGTEDAITAFQMDIKVEGITVDVMAKALEQAKAGRKHILQEMKLCDPPPRGSLSSYAPKIVRLKIDQDKIGLVVGSGGKTIRSIIEDSGVDNVEISPEGVVSILGLDADAIDAAKERIMALVTVPEVGTVYRNCTVQGVAPFGCFVEIAPGKQGLVHVRELSTTRIENVEDHFKVGDVLDVKLLEINERGQLRLSHRAILLENEKGTSPKPGAPTSSPGPGGVSEPVRAAVRPMPKGVWQRPGPSTGAGNGSGGAQGSSSPPLQKPASTSPTSEPAKKF